MGIDPKFLRKEGHPPRVGISSMVLKEGKILLGRRKGSHGAGAWSTPGGHLEYGESVEACAERELLEETSLKALSLVIGPYTNDVIAPDGKHYITLFVFITHFEGSPICCEPEKCEGWSWFTLDALPSPLLTPLTTLIEEFGVDRLDAMSWENPLDRKKRQQTKSSQVKPRSSDPSSYLIQPQAKRAGSTSKEL